MGGVAVRVYGDYIDLADEIMDELLPRAKDAMTEARDLIYDEAKRLLTMRGPGPPAPPGQPPATQTGELVRSLRKLPVTVSQSRRTIKTGISSNHPGAARLEFGARTSGLIGPPIAHPWLRPAFENTRAEYTRILESL